METKTVTVPRSAQHQGFYSVELFLNWVCPVCGGPRGEPYKTISYDGSMRLSVDGWNNPCGHVDKYSDVRVEAMQVLEPE